MGKFKEKSSNEILMNIAEMQQQYELLKQELLKKYDELEDIEKNFRLANEELVKRLNGGE